MDPLRHEELISFIREKKAALPWPQVEAALLQRGCSRAEIAAAVDEIFPGRPRRKQWGRIRAGLVGAAVGALVWLILAALYHGAR